MNLVNVNMVMFMVAPMAAGVVDKPDLVPDKDVRACHLMGGGIGHRSYWQLLFSYCLGRQLTQPEVDEILSKVNGLGPVEYRHTYASLDRSSESFWRSQ